MFDYEDQRKKWLDLSKDLDDWRVKIFAPLVMRMFKIFDRIDYAGWPTRDRAAPEEGC